MTDKNCNDALHWTKKLDELDAIAEDRFDKNTSWQKLQSRKTLQPENKKTAWYWLAAACLLTLLTLPWIFASKKDIGESKITIKERVIEQNTILAREKIADTFADTPVSKAFGKRTIALLHPAILHKTDNFIAKTIAAEKLPLPALNLNPPADTSFKAIAFAPEKKKMKMVHINELGKSLDEPLMSQYTGKPFFPVKFYNKETFTTNDDRRRNGADIIKIKLSSQN